MADRARQLDLFAAAEVFPVAPKRAPSTAEEIERRLAGEIGRACKECGLARARIAAEMSRVLGERVSEHMLNAYASPGRAEHKITVARLKALVAVTGATWLWTVVLEGEGLTVLEGEEAIFAQLGWAQSQERAWRRQARDIGRRLGGALGAASRRRQGGLKGEVAA